jgi:hypothetical protein
VEAFPEGHGKWPDASLLALACILGLGGCNTAPGGGGPSDAGPLCSVMQLDLQAAPDGGVAACTFLLGTPPASDTTNTIIVVSTDGTQVAHDPAHASGWDYTDATLTAIRFFGPVCSQIQSGIVRHVTVTYPCVI